MRLTRSIVILLTLIGSASVFAQNTNSDQERATAAEVASRRPVIPVRHSQPAVLLDEYKADFDKLFEGTEGTFIIVDDVEGAVLVHNADRAGRRFSPWSTFEMAAALMIIDSGTLKSVDAVISWNPTGYPTPPGLPEPLKQEWESAHSLTSAYQGYGPWFFRDQIKRIDHETVVRYLKRFSYGNEAEDTEDGFWLGKDLAISATEQVAFLQNLVNRRFGLGAETHEKVLPLFVTQKTEDYTLVLKTGSGATDGRAFGWAVGYVERGPRRYFFAMNLDDDSYRDLSTKREEIVYGLLGNLGLIEPRRVRSDR